MYSSKSTYKHVAGTIVLMSISAMFASQAMALESESEAVPVPGTTFIQYDAKTYPGINCEAQAVAEIDEFLNVAFDMFNANPGKHSVVCPIVRDNTKNTDGTLGAYVNVYNVANRTLECTIYSADKFGLIVDSDTGSTSSSGNQSIFLDVDTSISRGYYAIDCELPNGAAVRSYEVRESLATDADNTNLSLP